eukprot:316892-Chlamydomonas_euryale.AAC.3
MGQEGNNPEGGSGDGRGAEYERRKRKWKMRRPQDGALLAGGAAVGVVPGGVYTQFQQDPGWGDGHGMALQGQASGRLQAAPS